MRDVIEIKNRRLDVEMCADVRVCHGAADAVRVWIATNGDDVSLAPVSVEHLPQTVSARFDEDGLG